MDYLFQDGGKPNAKKSKTGTKSKTGSKTTKSKTATKTTKSSSKTSTKTTKSKTENKKTGSKKGGNFLGAVGDLVAPTGWGSFVTTAALVGIDQADAALRRKKSEKSSVKKGGMKGGFSLTELENIKQKIIELNGESGNITAKYQNFFNLYKKYAENKIKGNFIPDDAKSYWSIFGEMSNLLYSIELEMEIDIKNRSNKYLKLKEDIDRIQFFIKNEQEEAIKSNTFNRYPIRFQSQQERVKHLQNMQNLKRRNAKQDNSKFIKAIQTNQSIIQKGKHHNSKMIFLRSL